MKDRTGSGTALALTFAWASTANFGGFSFMFELFGIKTHCCAMRCLCVLAGVFNPTALSLSTWVYFPIAFVIRLFGCARSPHGFVNESVLCFLLCVQSTWVFSIMSHSDSHAGGTSLTAAFPTIDVRSIAFQHFVCFDVAQTPTSIGTGTWWATTRPSMPRPPPTLRASPSQTVRQRFSPSKAGLTRCLRFAAVPLAAAAWHHLGTSRPSTACLSALERSALSPQTLPSLPNRAAVTYDGANLRFYMDGTLNSAPALQGGLQTTAHTLCALARYPCLASRC